MYLLVLQFQYSSMLQTAKLCPQKETQHYLLNFPHVAVDSDQGEVILSALIKLQR